MTTSEFERQVDRTAHGGREKHYLDMRMKNNSSKPVIAIESATLYANKMGDTTTGETFLSQNDKPIQPGEEYKSYTMDRSALAQSGAGDVTVYVSRVRFADNTFWVDNGSHSCAMTAKAK